MKPILFLLTASVAAAAPLDLNGLSQTQAGGGIKPVPITGVAAGEALIMDGSGVPQSRLLLQSDITGLTTALGNSVTAAANFSAANRLLLANAADRTAKSSGVWTMGAAEQLSASTAAGGTLLSLTNTLGNGIASTGVLVGVQGTATDPGGTGVSASANGATGVALTASAFGASGIPLRLIGSGAFPTNITTAATTTRNWQIPDDTAAPNIFASRGWVTGTLNTYAPLASPTFTGIVTASGTTASTSKDTGAIVTEGGIGVEGAVNAGTQMSIGTGGPIGATTQLSINGFGDYGSLSMRGTTADAVGESYLPRSAGAGVNARSFTTLANYPADGQWTIRQSLNSTSLADTVRFAINVDGTVTIPSLTASSAVLTDATSKLISQATTGTGNVMRTRTGVRRTIYVSAGAMIPRITNGAAPGTYETVTNKIMVDSVDFDQTVEEGVGFWLTLPSAWNTAAVTFKMHWTAAIGTGTVKWDMAAKSYGNADSLDAVLGTEATAGTNPTTANAVNFSGATSLTVGSASPNLPTYWQITRDTATDTMAADAKLLGVTIEYVESATEPFAQ